MQWTDIKITADRRFEDVFDYVSAEICPMGVQIEDYSDLEEQVERIAHVDLIEEDLLKKDRDRIIVHHYISPDADAQDRRLRLENRLSEEGVEYECEVEYVEQEDWETGWKKYYHAMDVGDRLAICPSWEEYDTDRKVIRLDPGMAFGTGTHETTFLCLEVLDRTVRGGERVLDVGTGSGILAIAALLLGAGSAEGVDIDPTRVKVAGENARLNGVADRLEVKIGDLADRASGEYDIILANIVANSVMMLSRDIPRFLKKGGIYVTSGIIDTRKDEVLRCLAGLGFEILAVHEKNGWVCIEATVR